MTPAARSSLAAKDDDTPVAPYLTHVITHHGQITLIPPQNQGRLRTNKKTRKLKTTRAEQNNPSTSSLSVSSLGSQAAPSQPKKRRKPRRNVAPETASENANTELFGGAAHESRILASPLAPPPSYDSLRSASTLSVNSDIISFTSGSASSDDFEDITQMDFESQWELDRMAGFTLEERVRREWQRRQASITRTTRPAKLQSLSSPHLDKSSSHDDDILSELSKSTPPLPPPKDVLKDQPTVHLSTDSSQSSPLESARSTVSSRRSGSYSPMVSSKNILQNTQDVERNLSKISLEDWDILEPAKINIKQDPIPSTITSKNPTSPKAPRSATPQIELFPDSDSIYTSLGIHPDKPVLRESKCDTPRSTATQEDDINNVTTPSFTDNFLAASQGASLPSSSRKGKEREIHNISETTSKHFAIHRRPLPTPPVFRQDPHSNHSVASSSKVSPLFWPQLGSDVTSDAGPPVPIFDCEPEPVAAISPTASSLFSHKRIPSMRHRPVPPPPAEFLARARTKRKPPPPPPSSYRYGVLDLRSPNSKHINSLDNTEKNPFEDGILQSVTIAHPDNLRLSIPGPQLHLLPPPSPISQPEGSVSNTTSPVLDLDDASSGACILGPIPPPKVAMEYSVKNRDSQDTVAPPIDQTSARISGEISVPTTMADSPHMSSMDPSVDDGPPGDDTSSVPPIMTSVPEGALGPYTDLDILLSRLDDSSTGNRYEDLLIVSELLGPAQPQSTPQPIGELPLGRIEVLRRRKLQDGRVKLKLSLFGVMVDRCGICLSQFKNDEWAVLLPCVHPFHSACLQSWLARNNTCPLCRTSLDIS